MITLFENFKIEGNQEIKSNKAIAHLNTGQKLIPLSEVDLTSKIMPKTAKIYLFLMNGCNEDIKLIAYFHRI